MGERNLREKLAKQHINFFDFQGFVGPVNAHAVPTV